MHDASLVHFEVNLALLNLLYSLCNVHRNSAALGVWHQAARAEYAAQRTELAHDGGLSDDDVHVSPSALDFVDVFVESDIIRSGLLGSSLGICVAEHQDPYLLAGAVGQRNDATHHLVCLARIYAKTNVNIQRRVELGESNLFHLLGRFLQCIGLPSFNLGQSQLLVFCQFSHFLEVY